MDTKTGVANATYRIVWIEGKAHLQRCPLGGTYDGDGELVRPATHQDRSDMYEGRIEYDPKTNPSSLAWAEHVRNGGD
jgi:hypothetical protein